MNSENNNIIIITGGIKRLGLLFAKRSLEMGYSVLLHYRTSIDNEALELAKINPKRISFFKLDLNDNPEQLITYAISMNFQIAGLVNNASTFTPGNLTDPSDFLETLTTNTITPMKLTSEFATKIKKGWIINITDANIKHPNLKFQNYRVSKLFLEELTMQMAVTFAPDIRVNAIAPGAMLPASHENEYFSKISDTVPLKSTGNTSSLVDTYEFLVKNDYLTGQIIKVDGGWGLL